METILINIGALGTINRDFITWARKLQIENYRDLMQRARLLRTAEIITDVLGN